MKCSEVDILAAHLASYLRLFENRCNICLTYYCWENCQNTFNSCFYSGSNPPGNPGCSKVLACTRCTFGRPIGLPIVKHVGTGTKFVYLILDKILPKTPILCFLATFWRLATLNRVLLACSLFCRHTNKIKYYNVVNAVKAKKPNVVSICFPGRLIL